MKLQEKLKLAIEECEREQTPMIVCTLSDIEKHFNMIVKSPKGFNKENLNIAIINDNMVVGTILDLQRMFAGRIAAARE